MKRVWEKIVEGILTCSGFVTSITILLIVVFLFAEALGLFNKKVIEEGYVLAVNKANPVQELSAAQIKDVFDEEITNWKELGGCTPICSYYGKSRGNYHIIIGIHNNAKMLKIWAHC